MSRTDMFGMRVNETERHLITVVAQQLDRNESDTMRYLLREKAREMGILPTAPKEDRSVANVATGTI